MTQRPITLIEYPPLISENKLVKERGWTVGLVRRHLGPPDALAANPYNRPDVPMRVYLLRRVERAERRLDIIADLERAAAERRLREMVVNGSIEELRESLADNLASVPINIRRLPIEELRTRAYQALNSSRVARGEPALDFPESELPADAMARYARKHLVDWEEIHERFDHRAEPLQVGYLLRDRIDAAVLDAFPELAPAPSDTA